MCAGLQMNQKHTNYVPVKAREAGGRRTKVEEIYQDCKIIQDVKESRFLMPLRSLVGLVIRFCF